jgi:prepilin-type N-terminal cleavage/methylation domain-containing protein
VRERIRGVTLIEMLIVVGILALAAAIAFPAVNSGIEGLRLNAATNGTVEFLNSALNRAERRQEIVEVTISRADNSLTLRTMDPKFVRTMPMPEGVRIAQIHPERIGEEEATRSYVLYPGGTVPRVGIELANRKGVHRIVRVDPITGVPQVEAVEPK